MDPRAWMIAPFLRRFPDEVVDRYEAEDTPLTEIYELWEWKYDLVTHGRFGPMPDEDKVTARLWSEVEDFLRIEEASREAVEQAELELRLAELGDAALDWRLAKEMQDDAES